MVCLLAAAFFFELFTGGPVLFGLWIHVALVVLVTRCQKN